MNRHDSHAQRVLVSNYRRVYSRMRWLNAMAERGLQPVLRASGKVRRMVRRVRETVLGPSPFPRQAFGVLGGLGGMEPLEARAMLSITPSLSWPSLSGASVSFTGTTDANDLQLRVAAGGLLEFSNDKGTTFSSDLDAATGGVQSLTVSGSTSITVNLGDGTNTLSLDASLLTVLGTTGMISYTGGSGADTIVGPVMSNQWRITGSNLGTLATAQTDGTFDTVLIFSGVENLTGGAGGIDSFLFLPSGSLTGTLTGQADDKDAAGRRDSVTVELQADGSVHTLSFVAGGDANSGSVVRDANKAVSFTGISQPVGLTVVATASNDTISLQPGATVGTVDILSTDQVATFGKVTVSQTERTEVGLSMGDGDDAVVIAAAVVETALADGDLTIDGGTGSNTITSQAADNAWAIAKLNEGSLLSHVWFTNVQNLVGSSGRDVFSFADAAALSGTVDGKDGQNTLDYSQYTTAVAVDFGTLSASGIATVKAGKNTGDTLTGPTGDSQTGPTGDPVWRLTGLNTGSIGNKQDPVLSFEGFENITGKAAGRDTLLIETGGSLTGTFAGSSSGKAGLLVQSDEDDSYTVVNPTPGGGLQTATIHGTTITFTGLQPVVSPTTMADMTILGGEVDSEWTLTDGPAGQMTLTNETAFFYDVATSKVVEALSFPTPTHSLSVVLGNANTIISLQETAGPAITVLGGTGINTLIARDGIDHTWTIDGDSKGSVAHDGYPAAITFQGVGRLVGGNKNDTFRYTTKTAATDFVDGGSGGIDTLDYSAMTAGVTVSIGFGNNGIDTIIGSQFADTLYGTTESNDWSISGTNSGGLVATSHARSSLDRTTTVNADGVVTFALNHGLDDGEQVTYASDLSPDTSGLTSGSTYYVKLISPREIQLSLASGGTAIQLSQVAWKTGNSLLEHHPVQIAAVTFSDIENLAGRMERDTFHMASGSAITGTVDGGAGANTLDFSSYGSAVTVNLGDSSAGATSGVGGGIRNITALVGTSSTDTLKGPNQDATWTITGANAGSIDQVAFNVNSIRYLAPVSFSGFENLTGAEVARDGFVFKDGGSISGTVAGGTDRSGGLAIDDGTGFRSVIKPGTMGSGTLATSSLPGSKFNLAKTSIAFEGIENAFSADLSGQTLTLNAGILAGAVRVVQGNDAGHIKLTNTDPSRLSYFNQPTKAYVNEVSIALPSGGCDYKFGGRAFDIAVVIDTQGGDLTADATGNYTFSASVVTGGGKISVTLPQPSDTQTVNNRLGNITVKSGVTLNAQGGDITLAANNVTIEQGAQILSTTGSKGPTGVPLRLTDQSVPATKWRPGKVYRDVLATGGSGSGLTVDIVTDNEGNPTISIRTPGTGFHAQDQITVSEPGVSFLGSDSPQNGSPVTAKVWDVTSEGVGGDITLSAYHHAQAVAWSYNPISVGVTIGHNTVISGRNVNILADADNSRLFDSSADKPGLNTDAGWQNLTVGLIDFLISIRPLVGVSLSKATADISIAAGASISASTGNVFTEAFANSIAQAFTFGLVIGFTYARTEASATVDVQGNVSSSMGNVTFAAVTGNTVAVTGLTSSFGNLKAARFQLSGAVTEGYSHSTVTIGPSSVVQAGGDIVVNAITVKNMSVSVTGNIEYAVIGISFAVAIDEATSDATVSGKLTAGRDIRILAKTTSEKNSTATKMQVGQPMRSNVTNAAFALVQGARLGFAAGSGSGAAGAAAGLIGALIGGVAAKDAYSNEERLKSLVSTDWIAAVERDESKFLGVIDATFGTHLNRATATVAGSARVNAGGQFRLNADVLDRPTSQAQGLAAVRENRKDSKVVDSQGNSSGFVLAIAANVTLVTNRSDAVVASGAQVIAGSTVDVAANTYLPHETTWDIFSSDETKKGLQVTSRLLQHLGDDNLGAASALSTFTQSSAIGKKTGFAVSGTYIGLTTSAKARVEDGASITTAFDVSVKGVTNAQTWNLVGNFPNLLDSLLGQGQIGDISTGTTTAAERKKQLGNSGDATGVGGSFSVVRYNNTAEAVVASKAIVRANDLHVNADSKTQNLSMGIAYGKSGETSVNGVVNYVEIIDTTLAQIGQGAEVYATGSVDVTANDTPVVVNIAGGVSIGTSVGFGLTVGTNVIKRDTKALIGERDVLLGDDGFAPNTGVNRYTNTIDLGYAHGFQTGDQVAYSSAGDGDGAIGGLADGGVYYARRINDTTIGLGRSPEEANQTAPTFGSAAFTGSNVLDLGYAHGFQTGDAVVYDNGGAGAANLGSLVKGVTYYVIRVDATHVKLASSLQNANKATALTLPASPTGSGTNHSLRLAFDPSGANGSRYTIGRTFVPTTAVTSSYDSINVGSPHGFQLGQAVVYAAGGDAAIGGLTNGAVYYVVPDTNSPNAFHLAAKYADAMKVSPMLVSLTPAGSSGTVSLTATTGTQHSVPIAINPQTQVTGGDATSAEVINLGYPHGFITGQKVYYSHGGGTSIRGLANKNFYYVIVVDATKIRLADSLANAQRGVYLGLDATVATGSYHTIASPFRAVPAVDDFANTIRVANANAFQDGEAVVYHNGGGTSIRGLSDGTTYYVTKVGNSAIKLSTSKADLAGTVVNLDPSGATGTHHSLGSAYTSTGTMSAAGVINVAAENKGTIVTVTLAAAVVSDPTSSDVSQDANAPQAPGGDQKTGQAVSGSVSVNTIDDTSEAIIRGISLTQAGGVTVSAKNSPLIVAVSGGAAISTNSKDSARNVGLAGAVTVNLVTNRTRAFIQNAALTNVGAVTVTAAGSANIVSVAAGLGGSSRGTGIAGSVAYNTIDSDTAAYLANSSLTGTSLAVTANDGTSIITVAGSLAYGGTIGIGAGIAINRIKENIDAHVSNTALTVTDAVNIAATNAAHITAVAAGIAVVVAKPPEDDPNATPKGMALAVGLAINSIDATVTSYVSDDGSLVSAGSLSVVADDADSWIVAVAGGVAVGLSKAENADATAAAGGAAFAFNKIDSVVSAYLDKASVTTTAADGVVVRAHSKGRIEAYAIGGAVASASSGAGGATTALAGVGAFTFNTISKDVTASIRNGSNVTSQSSGPVKVSAKDESTINSIAGAIAIGVGLGGGGESTVALSVGASVANNKIKDKTASGGVQAVISDSYVVAAGNLSVVADSQPTISVVAFAGSLAFANGGATAAAASGAGAAATNEIDTTVRTAIVDTPQKINSLSPIRSEGGKIDLTASDTATVTATAVGASLSFAKGDNNAAGLAIGVSIARNRINDQVTAELLNADVTSKTDVGLTSTSSSTIKAVSVAASVAFAAGTSGNGVGLSGGGAEATNIILSGSNARIQNSAVTAVEDVVLASNGSSSIHATVVTLAMALGRGTTVGAGVAIGAAVSTNFIGYDLDSDTPDYAEVQAYVRNSTITAQGDLTITANTDAAVISAEIVAVSAAISQGTSVGIAVDGSGAAAKNKIATSVKASIDYVSNVQVVGGPTGVYEQANGSITAKSVTLLAQDNSAITATAVGASVTAAFGSTAAGVAIGVSLARNEVANVVSASIVNANMGNKETKGNKGAGITATAGAVSLSAVESAEIKATSVAVALSAAFGSLAAAASGAGADAYNIICNQVQSSVVDSNVNAPAGDVKVEALSKATINSLVGAVAGALSGGETAAAGTVGVSIARNFIGYTSPDDTAGLANQVLASVERSVVTASGNVTVSASAADSVDATAFAGSVAIALGPGGAVAAAGVGSKSMMATKIDAHVSDSTVGAGGDVNVVSNGGSTVTKSEAIGVALSASLGAVSVAASEVTNTIKDSVSATISGSSVNKVNAGGNVSVSATMNAEVTKTTVVAVSVSLGAYSASGGGVGVYNTIDNTVTATISGAMTVTAREAVSLQANETAEVNADATVTSVAFSVGAALGVAILTNTIKSTITATVDDATIVSGSTSITAASVANVPTTTTVGVSASGGAAASGNRSDAIISTSVAANATNNATLTSTGDVTIQATSKNTANSSAYGGAMGTIAIGAMIANIQVGRGNDQDEVVASVGTGTKVTANNLHLTASGNDTLLSKSIAAGGGALAAAGAESQVTSDNSVQATIGNNAVLNLTTTLDVKSTLTQDADASADSYSIALAAGSGAGARNEFTSKADVRIGAGAAVDATNILINAGNTFVKDEYKDASNLRSGSASLGNVTALISATDIGTTANPFQAVVDIGSTARLTAHGTRESQGVFRIESLTNAKAYDSVRIESVSGFGVTVGMSRIDSTANAMINVTGATLENKTGDLVLTTRGESDLTPSGNLLVASYAGGGAGVDAKTTANVTNAITIDNSTVKGSEVFLQSGRDKNGVPNLLSAHSDAVITTVSLFPTIAVPIVTAVINESDTVSVKNGSKVQAVKNVNLLAIKGLGGNDRARTDGTAISLSLLPYFFPVPNGAKVNSTNTVTVDSTSNVTAGSDSQTAMLIRPMKVGAETKLAADKLGKTLSAADKAALGVTVPDDIAYEFARIDLAQITFPVSRTGFEVSQNTVVKVVGGANAGGEVGSYYSFLPATPATLLLEQQDYANTAVWQQVTLPADKALADRIAAAVNSDRINTKDTVVRVVGGANAGDVVGGYYRYRQVGSRDLILDQQNYADTTIWQQVTLPADQAVADGIVAAAIDSNKGLLLRDALSKPDVVFYCIKPVGMAKPVVTIRNLGAELVKQRDTILALITNHATKADAVARYQVQLDQINATLQDYGMFDPVFQVKQNTVVKVMSGANAGGDVGSYYTYLPADPANLNLSQRNYADTTVWQSLSSPTATQIAAAINSDRPAAVKRDLDSVFIQVPQIYVAPGSVFIEADSQAGVTQSQLHATPMASITIQNQSPFNLVVGDAVIDDATRVTVVNGEYTVLTPGRVYFNNVSSTDAVAASKQISITQEAYPFAQYSWNADTIPPHIDPDIYITGQVVNETGGVTIDNQNGSINVSGEIRGGGDTGVTITSAKDFTLNSDNWYHSNQDPRQYDVDYYDGKRKDAFPQAGIPIVVAKDSNQATDLQTAIDGDTSKVVAQGRIAITARYLNINGLVQSGVDAVTLKVDTNFQGTVTGSSLLDASGKPLTGISFGADGAPVKGYFDAQQQAIVVSDIAPQGGEITIAGNILSTGNGRLKVASGYASVDIDNQSAYGLILNRIDTTTFRKGRITIVDTARSPVTKTEYLVTQEGIETTTFTATVNNPLSYAQSGVPDFKDAGTDVAYSPKAGLLYVWTEGQAFTTTTINQYDSNSFNLLGYDDDNLAKDKQYPTSTTTVYTDDQPLLESESLVGDSKMTADTSHLGYAVGNLYTVDYSRVDDKFVDVINGSSVIKYVGTDTTKGVIGHGYRYIGPNAKVHLPDQDYTNTALWTDLGVSTDTDITHYSNYENFKSTPESWTTGGGWMREKSYHTKNTVEKGQKDFYTHTLKADNPIEILAARGAASPTVTIHSNKNIQLSGLITSPSVAAVTIKSNASLTSVQGAAILTKAASQQAGRVSLRSFVSSQSVSFGSMDIDVHGDFLSTVDAGGGAVKITAGGDIDLTAVSADNQNALKVNSLTAGGNVTLRAPRGITAADENSLIQGNRIELLATAGGIGSSEQPVRINSSPTEPGGLVANAQDGIFILETTGDLRLVTPKLWTATLGSIRSGSGDVRLEATSGSILDALDERVQPLSKAKADALDTNLQLSGNLAEEAARSAIRAEESAATQDYHTYWQTYRNAKRDAVVSTVAVLDIVRVAASGQTPATDTIAFAASHTLKTGDQIFLSGAAGVTSLNDDVPYYVIKVDDTHIRLANDRVSAAIAEPPVPLSINVYGSVTGISLLKHAYTTTSSDPTQVTTSSVSAIDAASDTIAFASSHGLNTGDQVVLNGVADVTNLLAEQAYFVVKVDSTHIQLAASRRAALAQSPSTVDITVDGSVAGANVLFSSNTRVPAAVTAAGDAIFFASNPGLKTGDQITFSGTSGRIDNVQDDTPYFVVKIDNNNIGLAATYANAVAKIPVTLSLGAAGSLSGVSVRFQLPAAMQAVANRYGNQSYDPDFVSLLSQAEINQRIADRTFNHQALTSSVSEGVFRLIYPETPIPNAFVYSPTGTESPNVVGANISLIAGGAGNSIGFSSGLATLDFTGGFELLTKENKQLLSKATVSDIIGVSFATYRYTGALASVDLGKANYADTSLWQSVTQRYSTTADTGSVPIATNDIVLVQLKDTFGLYTYGGAPAAMVLQDQNFANTLLWAKLDTHLHTGSGTQSMTAGTYVENRREIKSVTLQAIDDVDVEGSGAIVATAAGAIDLSSEGHINIDSVSSTGGDVRLRAKGDIVDHYSIGVSAAIKAAGTFSVTSTGGGVSGTSGSLRMQVGALSADVHGNLDVQQVSGDLTVLSVNAGGKAAINAAAGAIAVGTIESGDLVTLIATSGINSRFGGVATDKANVAAKTISLDAGSGIGAADNFFLVGPSGIRTSASLHADAGSGSMFLRSLGSLDVVAATASTGEVTLTVEGDAAIGVITAASSRIVTIEATQGIADLAGPGDITAGSAILKAVTKIGSMTAALHTKVSHLEAIVTTGGLWIDNTGDVEIGGVSSLVGLSATSVTLSAHSTISVDEAIDSDGPVLLTATDDIVVAAAITSNGGDVAILADNDIAFMGTGRVDTETGTGSVTLRADNDSNSVGKITSATTGPRDIAAANALLRAATGVGTAAAPIKLSVDNLEGTSDTGGFFATNDKALTIGGIDGVALPAAITIVGVSAGQNVVITAEGLLSIVERVASTGGDIMLRAIDGSATGQDLTVKSSGAVQAVAGNVGLLAGDDLTIEAGGSVQAAQAVTIRANDQTADTADTKILIDGSVSGSSIAIDGSSATATTITIDMSTAGNKIVGPATVTGGSAHDVMNVIRLNDRANTLTLDGRGGADAYNVTFRGPAELVSGYAIDVVDSGIDAAADVLNIAGSAQADLLQLRASTDPAGFASVASLAGDPAIAQAVNYTKSIASLSIATNGGNDTVLVDDNWAVTTIDGGAGQNTYSVGNLSASAVEDLDGTKVAGGQVLSHGVSYQTTINGGDEGDSFTVRRNLAAVTLNGGAGDDAFVVNGFAEPSGQPLVNAGVSVDGGGGTANTLHVTGTDFADTFSITGTNVSGAGVSATYARIQSLTVRAGDGDDTVTVVSTHAGTTDLNTNGGGDTVTLETVAGITTVNTAGGSDTVNVQTISAATTINTGADADTVNVGSTAPTTGGNVNSIAALLTVNGDSGSDALNVDDTGDTLANTGTLTGTTLTGLGMVGKIVYGTFEGLTIGLGSGGDTFTVASTHAGTTELNTNSGTDTVNLLATSGATTVNAGGDDDVINVGNGDLDPLRGAVAVTSGGGNDRVYVNDGAADNTKSVNYRVTPSSVTSTLRTGAMARAFAGLTFDGSTERLSLAGTNVANTFVVVPSQATTFDINGNLPATGTVPPRSGDKLLIDLTTVSDSFLQLSPTVSGSGVWSFGDALPVRFTSIEKFNDSTVAVVSDLGVDSTYGVKVFDAASGILKFEVPAERLYGTTSLVGVRAVMGDLTGDGLADLVVGPNKGVPNAFVRIFDGRDGRLVTELRPYGDLRNHVGGINVAVGDVNGDGWYDLVVSPVGPIRAPIRVFSGEPGHFLEKIGPDLWPMGRSAAAEFTIVVADQDLNGPANRGRVFVGSAVNGIATVHSFTLSVNNAWVATADGRFRPFGNTGRGTPRLSVGDSNADGVQDLIVSRPNDVLGRMRVFDGAKLGIPLGSEFATIPSRQAANDETAFMFDFNGDGRDESIVAFRSTIGVSPAVTRFDVTGKVTGGFSTNVSNAKELTGFWLVNGRTAYLSQNGQEISLTYPDGRTAKGLLVGTRYINVPSEKIIGEINGGTIKWNKGRTAWQRVTVTGTYEKDGTLFHVQQQSRLVRVWTDSGEYGSGTIDATGAITPKASSGLLGGTIFDIRWAGSTLGKRFDSAVVFTDSRNRRVRMFETANGDLTFVEASGKAAYGKWIAPGTVQVTDWNGTVGVVSNGSITWNDSRKMWKKV